MPKPRKWDLALLPEVVANSRSIAQILEKLGLKPAGGNYRSIQKMIKELNLDTSHLSLNRGWSKGLTIGPKKPLAYYLVKGKYTNSNSLRKRLINEGIFSHKCNRCGITEWNNVLCPLELEHKDGDHLNNELSNLELLCPNCHAQTSTYRGKNKRQA